MEQRDELLKQHPWLSIKRVNTMLKKRFNGLNAEKKTLYLEMAAKYKEEKDELLKQIVEFKEERAAKLEDEKKQIQMELK